MDLAGETEPEKTDSHKNDKEITRDRNRLSDLCADIKVRDIMSTEATVVKNTETIDDIIEIMIKNPYHTYPVLDPEDELIGVIDQDNILELLFFERSHRNHHTHLMAVKALSEEASTLMVHHPVTISPESSLCDAADLMIKHHIDRICVVENKKLAGIITKSDLIKKIYELRSQ